MFFDGRLQPVLKDPNQEGGVEPVQIRVRRIRGEAARGARHRHHRDANAPIVGQLDIAELTKRVKGPSGGFCRKRALPNDSALVHTRNAIEDFMCVAVARFALNKGPNRRKVQAGIGSTMPTSSQPGANRSAWLIRVRGPRVAR